MQNHACENQALNSIVEAILGDYEQDRLIDQLDGFALPNKRTVEELTDQLLAVVFPGYFRESSRAAGRMPVTRHGLGAFIETLAYRLQEQITLALRFRPERRPERAEEEADGLSGNAPENALQCQTQAEEITLAFFRAIPEIRGKLAMDVEAFFDADPAAKSRSEIICSYPGLRAIAVYRLAHVLSRAGVPILPRVMTEYEHGQTGIDIHPSAEIGNYFFIDHGTGVVIGETTVIGDHVKLYQGVTLGGLSTRGGQRLRGVKRHPTIEDRVTIYSGASILGGETVIGHDCVIGGNVFLTRSVAPNTKVIVRSQELSFDRDD